MNSKAMAEGRKCNGYLCYEAVGAADPLPHALSPSLLASFLSYRDIEMGEMGIKQVDL